MISNLSNNKLERLYYMLCSYKIYYYYHCFFFLLQSEDGDIIDCVNIYGQPAFDHPALKNHTIKVVLLVFFLVDFYNKNNNIEL